MELPDTKIIVALIAVFVSFIGLLISKEQKISEFRQAWIDKIRDDISDFMGVLNQFSTGYLIAKFDTKKKHKSFLKEQLPIIYKLNMLSHRIILRLNSEKDKELIDKFNEIEKMITSTKKMKDDNLFEKLTNDLSDQSHILLKKEWERVKKGEPIFIFFKWIFGIATVGIVVYAGYYCCLLLFG